jgi:hypothetical protein
MRNNFQFREQAAGCEDWDLGTLHSTVQKDIPAWEYLKDDIPFAIGLELIMNIPIDHQ